MANKYVDVSATHNGDGTSSAQAASDGATGAWNDLAKSMSGTSGYAPAAEDVVYVRTKASGSNLGQTLTANLTFSSTPTSSAHITWMFDNGTVWSGDSGTFTLTVPVSYTVNCTDYHDIVGQSQNLVIYDDTSSGNHLTWLNVNHTIFKSVKIQYYALGSTAATITTGYNKNTSFIDCLVVQPNIWTTGAWPIFYIGNASTLKLVNTDIDITGQSGYGEAIFNLGAGTGGALLNVMGGKIIGSNENRNLIHYSSGGGYLSYANFDGFDPGLLKLQNRWVDLGNTYGYIDLYTHKLSNIPGGKFDYYENNCGNVSTWRYNQNYPTLNAQLPDATYWTVKVFPTYSTAGQEVPASKLTKYYNGTAATKTITTELLINQSYTSISGSDWFMEVSYTDDSTGATKSDSTRFTNALTTSTAGWSTTSYGAENYSKYKLTYTTPTAIKQNSDISVRAYSLKAPPSATSFYFIDPDFTIT